MLDGVNLRTMVRFQFGRRDAIETVARSRAALFTGIFLVLLTGVPRNYDQSYILDSPLWLFGPLIFSSFSGTFLFLVLYKGFIRRRLESTEGISTKAQWRSFMSLFWMTAPVAWLYAIPVERFLGSYQAAQANLTLLAIVSVWRVLLMSRIISVIQRIKFARAFAWVLVAASLETLLVVFVGHVFSQRFSRALLAGMAGMRNAPEEDLMLAALGNILMGAIVLLVIVITLLNVRRFGGKAQSFPEACKDNFPVTVVVGMAAVWTAIAIPEQIMQRHFVTHAALIGEGKYREALDYMGHYSRDGFPASRRIEPNPYEYRVWEQLPRIIGNLKPNDPEWIRQVYLEHIDVMFSHEWLQSEPAALVEMLSGLERLPEGRSWIEKNRSGLSIMRLKIGVASDEEPVKKKAEKDLAEILSRLGVDQPIRQEP